MKTVSTGMLLGLIAGLSHSARAQAQAEVAGQQAVAFERNVSRTVEARYLLFLPREYDPQADRRWPVMLFLHGAGERGTDLAKVAIHGPPKIARHKADFPFIVVSPQCPSDQVWDNEVLIHLLDDVIRRHRVDTNRIYLTGLSMGGYGTWSLGLAHPERFAAIAPICGGGETIKVLLASRNRREALRSLGVWAFHGGKDDVVKLEESERMVEVLKRTGVTDVRLTVYPEAGHDSWTKTYEDQELYDWLLRHHR